MSEPKGELLDVIEGEVKAWVRSGGMEGCTPLIAGRIPLLIAEIRWLRERHIRILELAAGVRLDRKSQKK